MTQQEVIERFCALATEVAEKEFGNTEPSDCFCRGTRDGFRFSEEVMRFIEIAVKDRLPGGGL